MALFRVVSRNSGSKQWAYVEWSDEDKNHIIILGDREFSSEEEALEFSKGFEPESYVWVEPNELKIKRLTKEKQTLEKRLIQIVVELAA